MCVRTHRHACIHTTGGARGTHTRAHTHINGLAYLTSPFWKGIEVVSSSLLFQVMLQWITLFTCGVHSGELEEP